MQTGCQGVTSTGAVSAESQTQLFLTLRRLQALARGAFTCVALQDDHGDHGIIVHAHHVNHARSSPHAHTRPQGLNFRVCSIFESDERVRRETASVTVHKPDHA